MVKRARGESLKSRTGRQLITVETPVKKETRRNSEKRRVKNKLIHSDEESEKKSKYKVST